jgi:hypothetical protein
MRAIILASSLLPLALAWPMAAQAAGLKAVVFDLEPVEMPNTPQVRDLLAKESALLRKMLADKGYEIVDTTPQAKKIADNLPLSQCNGCDQDIAKALGADIEVTSAVQQSSSAIFNLSGNVKDVASNRVLREGVVDIRGQGEDVWNHGIKFLVRERLMEPPLPTDKAALTALVDSAAKPAK